LIFGEASAKEHVRHASPPLLAAINKFQTVLQLEPNYVDAQRNLQKARSLKTLIRDK
jgi:hypothetical protein